MTRRLLPWLLVAVLGVFVAPAGPLRAASDDSGSIVVTLPPDLDAAERSSLVQALDALDRPVAVEDAAAGTAVGSPSDARIAKAMAHLDGAIHSWHELPGVVGRWWQSLSTSAGSPSSSTVMLLMLLAVAIGAAAEWLLDRLLGRWRRTCNAARPNRFVGRLGYALAWVGLELVGIAAFALVALLVGWLLLPAANDPRFTLAVTVAAIAKARAILTLIRFIFSPFRPALRLAHMPDGDARTLWRWAAATAVVVAFAGGLRALLLGSGLSNEAATLLGILVALFVAIVRLVAIFGVRRPIHDLIVQAATRPAEEVSGAVTLAANLWHVVFAILVLLDFVGVAFNALLSDAVNFASFSAGSFVVLCLVPFALVGYGKLIDDLLLHQGEGGKALGGAGALKAFGQGLILLGAFTFLAQAWGADPFAGEAGGFASLVTGAVLQVGGAVLLGWTVWQGTKLAIDHYAEEDEDDEVNEDAMGKPGSRIATVLPFIRIFIFIAIVTISAMMALGALGVNIGPLLAGAGVIGLAVGFGAQTLVTDIITGLFYLVEDAFRKGEYIQCKAGKGVVEKISLRSVQLRHHNGPLHTIPFGSMGNITNHSRDWVRVKMMIRVPFDSDLNKVRKAIKKVGIEMQEDPALGPLFLEPLKSQGAVDTDSSGFVTSVKFVSRPGEQFVLRREAFARIQKAFAENNIEFAAPRITVDSDDEGERQGAAAAAVRRMEAEAAR